MWVLDSDGDVLKGKKLWLRPGKKFLIGRVAQQDEPGGFWVDDKSISRRHLTVEVDEVPPEEYGNPATRSRILLTDCKSKVGTQVNGVRIEKGASLVLDKPETVYNIKLGHYKHDVRFTWVPVTLTYSLTTKEIRTGVHTAICKRLGPLDIKVPQEYDRRYTTHVVAKKRNTAKGLQALINGKHIVLELFVDNLVTAATPGEGGAALLEKDFEAHFPDASQYLPPRGQEPTERSESAYGPNPARQDMFAGYTFVFYEKTQYDNLFRPIEDGSGKAMLRVPVPNETTVDDFVRYVKGVAGEKGLGEFEDGSEGKGVVVVKFNPVKGAGVEWYANFCTNVALYLDHRLIEQNEFLDAILGNDASVLRRPLEVDSSGVVAPPPTAGMYIATNASFRAPQGSAAVAPSQPATQAAAQPPTQASEMAPPTRRGRSRRIGKKFIGFDDDDFSSMAPSSAPESMVVEPTPVVESQHSQGLFVSQDPDMDVDRPASQASDTQRQGSSKRKRIEAPIFEEEEEEENLMEQIAPAQAALRKRQEERGEYTAPAVPKSEPRPPPAKKVKKELKEIDVIEINRQKHEEAKALAEAERESLLEQLEGMDIEQMRNLAIIEEVPVVRKPPPIRTARADESDRWDNKWNGRKDFKRFRRRGADGNGRIERVIVPLEEVRTKDFGLGDEYWGEGDSQKKKKKDKGKERDTQDLTSQMEFNTGSGSRSTGSSAPKSKAVIKAGRILAVEGEDEFSDSEFGFEPEQPKVVSSDVEIVSPPPKPAAKKPATKATTTRGSRSQKSVPSQEFSTTQGRSTSGSKRAAESAAAKAPPAKKQRQLGLKKNQQSEDEDEDSDDDLKFKFKRR
ncbi:hypothetical protein BDZ45DRAFT_598882 [Acephala macrosclerotiorum]|nr:hypothetical protein BDZ45DRAFT_598882 [Acephala macrosclerotiorum]